ncbi:hypothetical protein LWC35_11715 [Pseudonocardia kujensis]|uniref:hypothetical protein n=1 Tax=Pseudonocardia kujensis TaxID=1128675 RepID=UPI001E2FA7C0|nr:hypothetical protein [Pseudonocardia kujensis]MCE0763565.1 hypothetical protein [Pseudonocardia kujensis]
MANARPAVREFRVLRRACLAPSTRPVPRPRARAADDPSVRLAVVAAVVMVVLAGGLLAAVSAGAPAAVVLGLCVLALLVRPLAVLRHRRVARRPGAGTVR